MDATAPKNIIGFGLCIIFIGALSSDACVPTHVLHLFCQGVWLVTDCFETRGCVCSSAHERQAGWSKRIVSCLMFLFGCCSRHVSHAASYLGPPVLTFTLHAGIFVNLSVRKPLVIDYKLPYPTGTATGVMINSFFTNGALEPVRECNAALLTPRPR